jgi:undecaprenyl-diphosphatase
MTEAIPNRTAALAAIAGLAAFACLALLMRAGLLQAADRSVLIAIRTAADTMRQPAWFQDTVSDVTALGGYPVLTITVVLATLGLWLLGRPGAAAFAVATPVCGTLLSTVSKLGFARPRPDVVDQLDRTFTQSFPSGHAMMSLVVWVMFALIAVRFSGRSSFRAFVLAAGIALTAVIGTSRLYLGVHWPSDVLAGWSLGTAYLGAAWLLARRLQLL